jgi:uncharacterized protein YprB with RNaseH-like and TPR domain
MLSDELRRRISLLNRGQLRSVQPVRGEPDREARLPFPSPEGWPEKYPSRVVQLESAVPGQIVTSLPSQFYRIEKRLTDFHHIAGSFVDRFGFRFNRGHIPAILDSVRAELLRFNPSKWLFLDIECCGLSNSPVFLVGLMSYSGGDFQLWQLLARDYSEEAAMLGHMSQILADYSALITFNGKTFDLPFLLDRCSIHAIPLQELEYHFDVLHAARKQWGRTVPNCKLQTLERFICKRTRSGDIPGEQIPEAYHEFVRTQDAWRMVDILHHNVLDLVTMCELTLNLFEEDDTAFL